jgi:tRNA A58 N-methylase Trm61
MVAGLCVVAPQWTEQLDKPLDLLILGASSGVLPMFLTNNLGEKVKSVIVVEKDADLLTVAKEWFGFEQNETLQAICAKPMAFVDQQAKASFDALFIDIQD